MNVYMAVVLTQVDTEGHKMNLINQGFKYKSDLPTFHKIKIENENKLKTFLGIPQAALFKCVGKKDCILPPESMHSSKDLIKVLHVALYVQLGAGGGEGTAQSVPQNL
uniref:Uncharacterized protein n=1 Tax=Sphaerodactylus townsendi TaxID=933632 RepID=A0ACB8E8C1_9SAUR